MQVLFICHANMCRSAIAEGMARKLASERSLVEPVVFRSCGLMAFAGQKALPQAVRAAADYGVDLSVHESTPLTLEIAEWADYLVTMTRAQKREAAARFPMHHRRIFTFAEFLQEVAGQRPAWRDIVDPVGRSDAEFRRCALRIHDALVCLLDVLAGVEPPERTFLERFLLPRNGC